jgi:hypothetical protein
LPVYHLAVLVQTTVLIPYDMQIGSKIERDRNSPKSRKSKVAVKVSTNQFIK